MELKLEGHFSYVDKYNRLIFVSSPSITQTKLARHCAAADHKPFAADQFIVTMPKNTPIDESITKYKGYYCGVTVKVATYKFVSKLECNRGEKVAGTKLILCAITTAHENNTKID